MTIDVTKLPQVHSNGALPAIVRGAASQAPSAGAPAPAADRFDEISGAGAPDGVSTFPLGHALAVFGWFGKSFIHAGKGDVGYWRRKHEDGCRTANSFGRGLQHVASSLDVGTAARTSIELYASQLVGIPFAGEGKAEYWRDRGARTFALMHKTGAELEILAAGAEPDARGPAVGHAVKALAWVAKKVSGEGKGTLQYWNIAASNVEDVAHRVGKAIESLVQPLPEEKRAPILEVAGQLRRVSDSGRGDTDYWMNRTQRVASETRRLAEELMALADRL